MHRLIVILQVKLHEGTRKRQTRVFVIMFIADRKPVFRLDDGCFYRPVRRRIRVALFHHRRYHTRTDLWRNDAEEPRNTKLTLVLSILLAAAARNARGVDAGTIRFEQHRKSDHGFPHPETAARGGRLEKPDQLYRSDRSQKSLLPFQYR